MAYGGCYAHARGGRHAHIGRRGAAAAGREKDAAVHMAARSRRAGGVGGRGPRGGGASAGARGRREGRGRAADKVKVKLCGAPYLGAWLHHGLCVCSELVDIGSKKCLKFRPDLKNTQIVSSLWLKDL